MNVYKVISRVISDIEGICENSNLNLTMRPQHSDFSLDGRILPAVRFEGAGQLKFVIIPGENYPLMPPLIFLSACGASYEQFQISWETSLPENQRLAYALQAFSLSPGPSKKVYGLGSGLAVTDNVEKAARANWQCMYSGQDIDKNTQEIITGLFARSKGLLSKDLCAKKVLVVGVGSVGSYIVEQLARNGLGAFILMDPDIVEYCNLSRTSYDINDVGCYKVDALTRRILNINPTIDTQCYAKDILDFEADRLNKLVREADVIVAATDNPQAQSIINRFSYANCKISVYIGLYEGAHGGEVIVSAPEKTPCYMCATSLRHQFENDTSMSVVQNVDYGSGRLVGETALTADIQHVTSAAVKVILSALVSLNTELKLGSFLDEALLAGFSYLTMSMVPEYWFYPHVFNDVAGQYAYQSVWLTPTRREECPVCGLPENRNNPIEMCIKGPSLSALRGINNGRA